MRAQKTVVSLLLMFGLILFAIAGFSYWYYLQQWMETRNLYHAHFRDTSYLLMILGVACIIAFVVLFAWIPPEVSSQRVFVVKECPYCGKTLMEDMKFCPYCGKTMKEDKSQRGVKRSLHVSNLN